LRLRRDADRVATVAATCSRPCCRGVGQHFPATFAKQRVRDARPFARGVGGVIQRCAVRGCAPGDGGTSRWRLPAKRGARTERPSFRSTTYAQPRPGGAREKAAHDRRPPTLQPLPGPGRVLPRLLALDTNSRRAGHRPILLSASGATALPTSTPDGLPPVFFLSPRGGPSPCATCFRPAPPYPETPTAPPALHGSLLRPALDHDESIPAPRLGLASGMASRPQRRQLSWSPSGPPRPPNGRPSGSCRGLAAGPKAACPMPGRAPGSASCRPRLPRAAPPAPRRPGLFERPHVQPTRRVAARPPLRAFLFHDPPINTPAVSQPPACNLRDAARTATLRSPGRGLLDLQRWAASPARKSSPHVFLRAHSTCP